VDRAPPQTSALTAGERALYHQVHPLKLATDITTAIASLVLLSRHALWEALTVMFGPSIAAIVWGWCGGFLLDRRR
jgi:hypothetical protein